MAAVNPRLSGGSSSSSDDDDKFCLGLIFCGEGGFLYALFSEHGFIDIIGHIFALALLKPLFLNELMHGGGGMKAKDIVSRAAPAPAAQSMGR
jgi:hypothetical protein